jgi:hypothetical protein
LISEVDSISGFSQELLVVSNLVDFPYLGIGLLISGIATTSNGIARGLFFVGVS